MSFELWLNVLKKGTSHVDPEYLYKLVFGKDKAQVGGGVPSSQDGDT